MPELQSYLKREVPRDIVIQIRSGIRFVWPQLNVGMTTLWSPPAVETIERQTFVLMDNELLLSHAEATIRDVESKEERYRVGGLSAVFTYPAHRGSGAGEQVVRAATDHLRSGADLALLFCGDRVKSLYQRIGWESLPDARIHFGDPQKPRLFNEYFVMGIFFTQKGQSAREIFSREDVYVGPSTW